MNEPKEHEQTKEVFKFLKPLTGTEEIRIKNTEYDGSDDTWYSLQNPFWWKEQE